MMPNPQDFGDNLSPTTAVLNPELKTFRVVLKDGSILPVQAFRLFSSFDANLGLVVRALRSDDTDVGVFYAPIGWKLENPEDWSTV